MEIKLGLRKESWENLFYNIRNDPPKKPKGNLWAAVQWLEEQLDLCLDQDKTDIDNCVPKNQLKLNFNQK